MSTMLVMPRWNRAPSSLGRSNCSTSTALGTVTILAAGQPVFSLVSRV